MDDWNNLRFVNDPVFFATAAPPIIPFGGKKKKLSVDTLKQKS